MHVRTAMCCSVKSMRTLTIDLSVGSVVSRGQKMAEIIMLRTGTSPWRSEAGRVIEGVL